MVKEMISRTNHMQMPSEGEEIPLSVLRIEQKDIMLWVATDPVPQDKFPPCIKNILENASKGKGGHRASAILAAFLGQAGWSKDKAKLLWEKVALQNGVSEKIFEEWFGRLHCPRCDTMKSGSKGYPKLGLANLGYCKPDEYCSNSKGPVEYAAGLLTEEDKSRGVWRHVKTVNLAHLFNWSSGKEAIIELSEDEREDLENLIKEMAEERDRSLIYTRTKINGKLRRRFMLKEKEGPRRSVLSELL